MSILDWLGFEKKENSSSPADKQTETVRKIVRELDRLEPERARYIASFAYLLSRVAHADLDISVEETQAMERIVQQEVDLPAAQVLIVVQMAKTQKLLFGGTENFLVTREFNTLASREQKLALIRCLFAVSAADDSISSIETSEISQIASELNLEAAEVNAIKAEFADTLAVLQRP